MHTVTVCPRCKEEFMYHYTEVSLNRAVAWDADTKEPCSFETICQECDFKEKWVHKEVKVKKGNAHEHLNKYRLFVVDIESPNLDFRITVKVGNTNSLEWFSEDELEIV